MLTLHKASAGSGKTFALAKDYIKMLLGIKDKQAPNPDDAPGYRLNLVKAKGEKRLKINNRHRAILAITFTRKATEEMKTRIIKELRALSLTPAEWPDGKEPSKYADDLTRTLLDPAGSPCSRADLATAASLALRQLLFDFQNFHVSTIDSFFQRVLRTFARELDYPGDFELVLDDKQAMRAAVGFMLDDFNRSLPAELVAPTGAKRVSQLEQSLFSYMETQLDSGAKSNFFNRNSGVHTDIVDDLSKIGTEAFKKYADGLQRFFDADRLPAFAAALKKLADSIIPGIKADAEALFMPAGPVDPEWLGTKKATELVRERYMKGVIPESGFFDKSVKYNQSLYDPEDPSSPFSKKATDAVHPSETKAFMIAARQRVEYYKALKSLWGSVNVLSLLQHAWRELKALEDENKVVLISDTNSMLATIIGRDETPFVYERMGVQLHHFLIDEFQDTSVMQWDNLRPLLLNSLGEGDDSLIIGDEKQSIYRFRNSDSSVLGTQVEAAFTKERVKIDRKGEKGGENTNYRSSADVVRFNNTLFSILAPMAGAAGFGNVAQNVCDDNLDYQGHVKFIFESKEGGDEELAENKNLREMAQEILRLTDPSGPAYRMRDIAILINTNTQASQIVGFLQENYPGQIEVASDEAMYICNSAAVQLVLSVLKMYDQEQQAAAPVPGDKDKGYPSRQEAFMAINRFKYYMGMGGRHQALATADAIERALDPTIDNNVVLGLDEIKAEKPASLVSLIETVVQKQFSEQERAEHGAYLAALVDAAIDFAAFTDGTLHAFLDYMDHDGRRRTVGSDADSDAVKVLTIHKSKGLEFECVLIPMCSWHMHFTQRPKTKVWAPIPDSFAKELFPEAKSQQEREGLCPPAMLVELDSCHGKEASPFKPVYDEEWQKSAADAMNKTYVAFTRAKSELIVWAQLDGKDKEDLIGTYLKRAFEAGLPDPAMPGLMVELAAHLQEDILEIGQPTSKTEKAKLDDVKADKKAGERVSIPYKSKPLGYMRQFIAVDYGLELDKDIDDTPAADDDSDANRIEGIRLHDLMARIMREADLEDALAAIAQRYGLDLSTKADFRVLAKRLLDSPVAKGRGWFGDCGRVLVEQPIYDPEACATHRPDRVVVRGSQVDIIDYKFTDNPSSVGADDHADQVRRYAAIYRRMGYGPIAGYLCYPKFGKIIEIESL